MPRTPEQLDDIREQKKKLIMDTALEHFANKGYFTTSINDIAKSARIAKGLVYNYFKSKEELLITIIDHGLDELIHSFDPDHDGILTDEEFEFFIDIIFKLIQDNLDYWRLLFSLMMQPAVHKIITPKYKSLVLNFTKILENYYQEQGYENPKIRALAFGAFMDGISINYMMGPDLFPVEEVKQFIKDNYGKKE